MTLQELIQKHPVLDAEDFIQHANGGGWKHKNAQVDETVTITSD